jgi:hypothetical protein
MHKFARHCESRCAAGTANVGDAIEKPTPDVLGRGEDALAVGRNRVGPARETSPQLISDPSYGAVNRVVPNDRG